MVNESPLLEHYLSIVPKIICFQSFSVKSLNWFSSVHFKTYTTSYTELYFWLLSMNEPVWWDFSSEVRLQHENWGSYDRRKRLPCRTSVSLLNIVVRGTRAWVDTRWGWVRFPKEIGWIDAKIDGNEAWSIIYEVYLSMLRCLSQQEVLLGVRADTTCQT